MAASVYGRPEEEEEVPIVAGEARQLSIAQSDDVVHIVIPKRLACVVSLVVSLACCGLIFVVARSSAGVARSAAAFDKFDHSLREVVALERMREVASRARVRGDGGTFHEHAHRIDPFLRYAGFSCQSPGVMLRAFPDPSVIEIGAHDGKQWKELFSPAPPPGTTEVLGAKHLWSLEPSPDKQAHLREVVRQTKAAGHSVELFQLAVGSDTKPMKFWVDGKNSEQNTLGKPPPWVSQERFDKGAITVNVTTLDNLWKIQCGGRHITMLKVDTQGHEPAIMMSGPELFAKDPPDIIHMEYSPNLAKQAHLDGVALLEFLYSFGYICSDCNAFAPPKVLPDKRDFKNFTEGFGDFNFRGANHGAWTDIVCRI